MTSRWFYIRWVAAAAVLGIFASGCASGPRIADHRDAQVVSDQALILMNAGDNAGAIRLLDRVIRFNGGEVRDLTRRATAFATLNRNDAALRDLDLAVAREPDHWRTYLLRAVTFQKIGRYDAAIGDLDRAIALQPFEPELVRRRGYLRLLGQNFRGALADYEELSRILPNSLTGPFGRGVTLYLAGDWREATAAFDRQLRDDPRDGVAALWLVKASLRAGAPLAWEQFAANANREPEWVMILALLDRNAIAKVRDELNTFRIPMAGRRTVGACEQALFLGTWADIGGDRAGARANFESARELCLADSIERTEALVSLARLR